MFVLKDQAISQNLKLVLLAVVGQPFKIGVIILFDIKSIFTSIVSLGDVVRHPDEYYPC